MVVRPGSSRRLAGASPAEGGAKTCVLRSCDGLTGGSPVGVMTKQPRSWWPASREIGPPKRHDKGPLGAERVIGPHEEESCRAVTSPWETRDKAGAEPGSWRRRPWTV